MSSSKTSTTVVPIRISTGSKWSVSMRILCATPASSITASGNHTMAASPHRNQT